MAAPTIRCEGCGHFHGYWEGEAKPLRWVQCLAFSYGDDLIGGVARCYCRVPATAYLPPEHPKSSPKPAIAPLPLPLAA